MKIYIYITGLIVSPLGNKPQYAVSVMPVSVDGWELIDVIDYLFTCDNETLLKIAAQSQEIIENNDPSKLLAENRVLKSVIEEMKRDSHEAEIL